MPQLHRLAIDLWRQGSNNVNISQRTINISCQRQLDLAIYATVQSNTFRLLLRLVSDLQLLIRFCANPFMEIENDNRCHR
ncbi:MAG: hypothetical protein ACJAVI_001012 [Candidatus Azotimanducaceae bacterium]|jgi:hypothetical protein